MSSLLDIRNLSIWYHTEIGSQLAVDGVDLVVNEGEALGIVGESGSGKSTLAHGILRLLPNTADQQGEVVFRSTDLLELTEDEMTRVRGDAAAMVFQDPMTSFDPQRTIGHHLRAGLAAHRPEMSRADKESVLVSQLRKTGLPEPAYQSTRYPHELSGGMRQRGMLALATQNAPALLVADEPTTALDVTIQAQILDLFSGMMRDEESRTALILISHDLAVVRQVCSRIAVMYAGRVVEDAPTEQIFEDPRHPYTQALITATPRASKTGGRLKTIPGRPEVRRPGEVACSFRNRCQHSFDRCHSEDPALVPIGNNQRAACFLAPDGRLPAAMPEDRIDDQSLEPTGDGAPRSLVEVSNVSMDFRIHGARSREFGSRTVRALRDVSLSVNSGETLGVVGESGSGKSTLARIVLGLLAPTSGTVRVDGEDPTRHSSRVRASQLMQAVFQDPHGSLNPRMSIEQAIAEPLKNLGVPKQDRRRRVAQLLDEVQLPGSYRTRSPGELSGGQAQRVAIARALAAGPEIIVLDEPTSGLDISIQAHILNLLDELQARHGLTYILISHDLTIVNHLADRVAVMYLGRIVELAEADVLFAAPSHPYTAGLLAALPDIDEPDRVETIVRGEPPSPLNPPAGCSFHTRCPIATEKCVEVNPELEGRDERIVACHFPLHTEGSPPPLREGDR